MDRERDLENSMDRERDLENSSLVTVYTLQNTITYLKAVKYWVSDLDIY